jgi:hypothetical protein
MRSKFKSSIRTAIFVILFNFILSTVCFFLLWYWITPKLYPLIPGLSSYLQNLDDDSLLIAYDLYYTIASTLSVIPGATFAYRMDKQRKKAFLKYSEGRISYGEGIRYHFAEYGVADCIALAITVLLFSVLSVSLGDGFISKLFPLPFYMCRTFGLALGFLVSMILTIGSAVGGIFFAQKKWRAEFFID